MNGSRFAASATPWCGDPAAWRFVLGRYLPVLAVLSLLWEIAQLPLYTLWTQANSIYIAYAVLHCTIGDVLIGFGSLLAALIVTGAGPLQAWRWISVGAITVVSGFVYTVFSEWMNTVVHAHWAYSELMPVVTMGPIGSIGLSPLLQWIAVPIVALVISRRSYSAWPAGEVAKDVRAEQ